MQDQWHQPSTVHVKIPISIYKVQGWSRPFRRSTTNQPSGTSHPQELYKKCFSKPVAPAIHCTSGTNHPLYQWHQPSTVHVKIHCTGPGVGTGMLQMSRRHEKDVMTNKDCTCISVMGIMLGHCTGFVGCGFCGLWVFTATAWSFTDLLGVIVQKTRICRCGRCLSRRAAATW